MRLGLDADDVAVVAAAGHEAHLHVADDDVVGRAADADAEVRRGAVHAEDGDGALVVDVELLARLAPLPADVGEDRRLVERARPVQHETAGAAVAVDSRLHRVEGAHDGGRRVAAAGDVAGEAGHGRMGRGCERQNGERGESDEWKFHLIPLVSVPSDELPRRRPRS
jgi:hypothetical protein